MKFKTLCYALLAAFIIFGATDATAQKKSSRKGTSSSRSSAGKTSSGAALSEDKLVNNEFWGWSVLNEKDGLCIFWDADLLPNNNVEITSYATELEGSWSVSGKTLSMTGGHLKFNGTSANGGKTLNGTVNNGSATQKLVMYNVTNTSENGMDPKVVREGLQKGQYRAYLNIYDKKDTPEIGTEVTVKFTPDPDDPNTGTFKVTGETAMLKYAGVLKGDYEFGENALITSKMNVSGNDETPYADWDNNHFKLDLGKAVFKGYGNVPMSLYLIKK